VSQLRRATALVLALSLLSACATLHETGRRPTPGDLGAVHVSVFANDEQRRAGVSLQQPISGVLEQRVDGRWTPVFRSIAPSWTVASLEPGRYRIRFDARLDPRGAPEALERPVERKVDVRRGEVVDVELILDHVSPAMVAAGAAAIVIGAVLLHEWLDDLDLPTPPLPPPDLVDAAFWVTLDLTSQPPHWSPTASAPLVTSHFPLEGDLVAARRVRVLFSLSEPIDPTRLRPDAIRVDTADGTRLAGTVTWDAAHWWIAWQPESDLPRGAELTATLDPSAVVDPDGLPLAAGANFGFRTAP